MYSKVLPPAGYATGVVCLVHGLGEHTGRHQVDGEALAEARYVLAGFDLRGSGESEGQRGHTPSHEAYFDDIELFLSEVKQRYPPMFSVRTQYGRYLGDGVHPSFRRFLGL